MWASSMRMPSKSRETTPMKESQMTKTTLSGLVMLQIRTWHMTSREAVTEIKLLTSLTPLNWLKNLRRRIRSRIRCAAPLGLARATKRSLTRSPHASISQSYSIRRAPVEKVLRSKRSMIKERTRLYLRLIAAKIVLNCLEAPWKECLKAETARANHRLESSVTVRS